MSVSVRHNSRVAALVALVAAVVSVAWFSRALQTGSVTDWLWCVVVAAVGLVQLLVVRDGGAPLLVADGEGVRVRRGETWRGLRWHDIEHVEVQSPGSWLRDGQIIVHPRARGLHDEPGDRPAADGADTPAAERYVVALARTTRLEFEGLTGDLVADLDALSSGRVPVAVLTRTEPAVTVAEERHEEEGHAAADSGDSADSTDSVVPVRETLAAARSEVLRDSVRRPPAQQAIPAQRTGDGPVLVARVEDRDELSGAGPHPVEDPVIGPLVTAARNRARLSIDVLSERTRIRPHVLECIEVDDFEACGGDFYARGHLRTLARVFGLDTQQLLDLYDDRYAKAEIEARQVFEAELASGIGGGVRAAHTGPRWSLLAACVLALAGVWGVAQVFSDTPQELVSPAPGVVGSAGLVGSTTERTPDVELAPLQVRATGASPQVVVRDRDGRILWAGRLADGSDQQVVGLAPFEVTSSNGTAVKVSYLGRPKGSVGDSQNAGSRQFG